MFALRTDGHYQTPPDHVGSSAMSLGTGKINYFAILKARAPTVVLLL